MARYIAYDSGCSVCSQLAETIRQTAGGKIASLPLRDAKARELLDRAYPGGWSPGPYLIHSRPGRIRAWTGTTAAVRLMALVGPRGAWRIWSVARHHGIYLPPGHRRTPASGLPRRAFLKLTAGAATALLGLGLLPGKALAGQCTTLQCYVTSYCQATSVCGFATAQPYYCNYEDCYDAQTGTYCETRAFNCACGYCP